MQPRSGLAVILGAWLAVSPFVFPSTDTAVWHNLIVGISIVVFAGFNYHRKRSDRRGHSGVTTLIALLGVWTMGVPFVIDMGAGELAWATAIVGLLVTIVAAYNRYAN